MVSCSWCKILAYPENLRQNTTLLVKTVGLHFLSDGNSLRVVVILEGLRQKLSHISNLAKRVTFGPLVNGIICNLTIAGVCIWEILEFGKRPYTDMDNNVVLREVVKGYRLPKPDNCPADFWSVVRRCFLEKVRVGTEFADNTRIRDPHLNNSTHF